MASHARVLGLIPAKGGSQRVAMKNIRRLQGKPLIQWAAESARDSGIIDRLVLSTESEQVAAVARGLGIEVPFMRPAPLARDPHGVVDVALHALDALEVAGDVYDRLVIMLPTAPLRRGSDIRNAYGLFDRSDGRFLMSVSEYPHSPFSALSIDEDGTLDPCFPNYIGLRSQQMPKTFRCNGAIHILDVAAFRAARSYYARPLIPYIMPLDRSVDIDTEDDLRWAEFLLNRAEDENAGART